MPLPLPLPAKALQLGGRAAARDGRPADHLAVAAASPSLARPLLVLLPWLLPWLLSWLLPRLLVLQLLLLPWLPAWP